LVHVEQVLHIVLVAVRLIILITYPALQLRRRILLAIEVGCHIVRGCACDGCFSLSVGACSALNIHNYLLVVASTAQRISSVTCRTLLTELVQLGNIHFVKGPILHY
jgi:hypothetical protein